MNNVTINRFLDTNHYYGAPHGWTREREHTWATPQSAGDRVLIVLIENGGVDLGLPDLVNRLIDAIPGASALVGQDVKAKIVTRLRDWMLTTTDRLIESAELSLNRYQSARPDKYGEVVVLRDSSATYGELKNALFAASRAGKVIDVVILTHGGRGSISAAGNTTIGAADIRRLATEFGKPLSIRSVYMMNCVGSSLNQAWLDAGARTSAGSHENNYLPEPTTFFFFTAWKNGQTFESAVTGAYRRTIDAMNATLRAMLIEVAPLAGTILAPTIDVSGFGFVIASRPEVVGTGSLTINSDALPPVAPATATGQSLVTTVLPAQSSRADVHAMSVQRSVSVAGRSFIARWETPGAVLDQRISSVERFLGDRIAQPLTQAQIDALASFGVSVGAPAFVHSTLLQFLEAGKMAAVPGEIRKWTKVRRDGQIVESERLLERRRAEAELFGGSSSPGLAVPASLEVQEYSFQQAAPLTHYKNPPSVVGQFGKWTCWAAAFDSWTAVSGSRTSQDSLIRDYGLPLTGFQPGGLRATDFPKVATAVGMVYEEVSSARFTQDLMASRLRDHGHLLLVYPLEVAEGQPGVAHTVVVYGVGYPSGTGAPEMAVMDPTEGAADPSADWPNKVKGGFARTMIDYAAGEGKTLLVGWKKP